MTSRRFGNRWPAAVMLLAGTTAGCTATEARSPDRAPAARPSITMRQLPADIGQVAYPLDRYRLTAAEQRLMEQATYVLVRRCTLRFGLELPPLGKAIDKTRRDRYGLSDPIEARTWAYSLDKPSVLAPAWLAPIAPGSRLHSIVTGTDADGRPAKEHGLPAGGCGGSARRALAQDRTSSGDDLVAGLDSEAWKSARADARVQQAESAWQRCMNAAGYRYQNAVEAPYAYWGERRLLGRKAVSPAEKKSGIKPSRAEFAAALVDVRCKRTSGFLQTWVALTIARQDQLVIDQGPALRAHREALSSSVRTAKHFIRAG
ncbi:hypothetical protein [Kribbella solani]|uniref:Uncharacterized protein n=1 Tax=Kribbella solani TaxID=236067 RepID=A0A841DJR1_9ACTN|nr:hypothetical protein [Kribbella solani]MBB5977315.1 hypothetical protein [Kribbella solani]